MTPQQYQSDPYKSYLNKLSLAESGGNPKAKNPYGSASGAHQFVSSTWESLSNKYKLGYSLEDRFDPVKSEKVAKLFTQENEAVLAPVLGRGINDADRYMAHFLGAQGAKNFFQAYNANPNASVSIVLSPAAIKANKGVAYNKDGSLKTLDQLYQWSEKKMDITPQSITQDFTDWERPNTIANFATSSTPTLVEVPEPDIKEPQEVQAAKSELEQKTNEYNFLQEYLARPQQIQQTVEAPQEQITPTDIVGQYSQVSQFIDQPLMQQGGQIPVSSRGMYDYPKQTTIVPTNGAITMQGIDYPVLAKSLETGEQKLLLPGLGYFFDSTSNVLEIPLI